MFDAISLSSATSVIGLVWIDFEFDSQTKVEYLGRGGPKELVWLREVWLIATA